MTAAPQSTTRRHPGTPGSSSSEDTSPRETSANRGKKRTRASKPKVRTGCITCKIRRVKCGEEKPACYRCTSTGRTCDGYDIEATAAKKLQAAAAANNSHLLVHRSRGLAAVANPPPLSLPPTSSATTSAISSAVSSPASSLVHLGIQHAAAATPGLRLLRPSAPDIQGTEVERRYFHDFRRVAETGISQHVANLDDFWQWTVPHMCLQDGALRRTVFALGAALRNYQDTDGRDATTRAQTEVFMLDQYSQAMALLRTANHQDPATTTLTLVCCLAFVYIESLRSDWDAALNHLRAGLAIIESTLPINNLIALADPKGRVVCPWETPLAGDLDYILRTFAWLECSASLYTSGIRPTIALRLYRARNLSQVAIPEFSSLREAHTATAQYCRDVLALSWICGHSKEEPEGQYYPDLLITELEILLALGTQLEKRFRQFQDSPNAPRTWSLAHTSLLIDELHFSCCRKLCALFARRFAPDHVFVNDPYPPAADSKADCDVATYAHIVDLTEFVKRGVVSLSSTAHHGRWFMLDTCIVSPVHFVVDNCSHGPTCERALRVLRDWPRQENLWDAREVGMLLREARKGGAASPEGLKKGLSLAVSIPELRRRVKTPPARSPVVEGEEDAEGEEEDIEFTFRSGAPPGAGL